MILYTRTTEYKYILANPQPNEDNFNEKTYYYLNNEEYIEATSYNSETQYYIKTNWVPIPALQGQSVYLSVMPTPLENNAGWTWTMVDERSGETATVVVYNGDAISVDEQYAVNGNISLGAISYSAVQELSTSAKSTARSNIDAMKAVSSDSTLGANQFITYSTIHSSWEATEMLATIADISNMFSEG